MTTETTKPDFTMVYVTDPAGAYLHEAQAQLSPLADADGNRDYLLPVHATLEPPPQSAPGSWPVLVNGAWVIKADHRGKVIYNQADNTTQLMTALGDPPESWGLEPALKFQLEAAELAARSRIQAAQLTVACSDVHVTVGKTSYAFQADDKSALLIARTIQLATRDASTCPSSWRSSDNQNVAVTLDDLKNIDAAIMMQVHQAAAHAFELKDQVAAAANAGNLQALKSINW